MLTCTRAKVPYPGAFNPGARRGASFGVSGIGSGLQGEVEDPQGCSKYSIAPPFLEMIFELNSDSFGLPVTTTDHVGLVVDIVLTDSEVFVLVDVTTWKIDQYYLGISNHF